MDKPFGWSDSAFSTHQIWFPFSLFVFTRIPGFMVRAWDWPMAILYKHQHNRLLDKNKNPSGKYFNNPCFQWWLFYWLPFPPTPFLNQVPPNWFPPPSSMKISFPSLLDQIINLFPPPLIREVCNMSVSRLVQWSMQRTCLGREVCPRRAIDGGRAVNEWILGRLDQQGPRRKQS